MTTQEELTNFRFVSIENTARLSMLSTVDSRDNSTECWIECVNDAGETVRLIPDKTGWQDNRREVMVMNTVSGLNTKLFFTPGEYPQLHDITLHDAEAYKVMAAIPAAVLRWAVMRAK